MNQFEYTCVFIWGAGEKTTRILNEYGREGWELVAVTWVWEISKGQKERVRKGEVSKNGRRDIRR